MERSHTAELARFGRFAAWLTLAGIVLSGPVSLGLVEWLASQPRWRDAAQFADHYSPLQLLPYGFGFVLIGGAASMVVALVWAGSPARRGHGLLALVLTAAFTTFILLNYVTQTTIVPALLVRRGPTVDPFIELLSMANPHSVAWALEMWGYGFLGVALWLADDLPAATALERTTRALIVLNAAISVAGAVATAASPDWVFSTAGYLGFGAWNLLMVVLAGCSARVWSARLAHAA